jgi:phage regulator Rha-like protein
LRFYSAPKVAQFTAELVAHFAAELVAQFAAELVAQFTAELVAHFEWNIHKTNHFVKLFILVGIRPLRSVGALALRSL